LGFGAPPWRYPKSAGANSAGHRESSSAHAAGRSTNTRALYRGQGACARTATSWLHKGNRVGVT